jgi:hypothetical protein
LTQEREHPSLEACLVRCCSIVNSITSHRAHLAPRTGAKRSPRRGDRNSNATAAPNALSIRLGPGITNGADAASENAKGAPRVRRARLPVELPGEFAGVLDSYVVALASAILSQHARRTYASKVRKFLAWLAGGELEGRSIWHRRRPDRAVRDYRGYLQSVLKPDFRSPVGVIGDLIDYADIEQRRDAGLAATARGRGWPRVLSRLRLRPRWVGAPRA